MRRCALVLAIVGLFTITLAAAGHPSEEVELLSTPFDPAYGVSDTVVSVGGGAFATFNGGAIRANGGSHYGAWFSPSAGEFLEGNIPLPTGVSLQSWQLTICDTNAGADMNAAFVRIDTNGNWTIIAPGIASSGSSGCTTYSAAMTPHTVTNVGGYYQIEVNHNGVHDGSVALVAAHVRYKRQVTPAPAVATFSDVPTTHGFFRFVEALAAAGITGGCGGGNFCPNNPVTRGQMAVFLATALGLHWPN